MPKQVYWSGDNNDGRLVDEDGQVLSMADLSIDDLVEAVVDRLAALTLSGNLTLEDVDVVLGTATGTKIGTAAGQKLGFYGKAPIAQQTGVAVTVGGVHAALVATGLITA